VGEGGYTRRQESLAAADHRSAVRKSTLNMNNNFWHREAMNMRVDLSRRACQSLWNSFQSDFHHVVVVAGCTRGGWLWITKFSTPNLYATKVITWQRFSLPHDITNITMSQYLICMLRGNSIELMGVLSSGDFTHIKCVLMDKDLYISPILWERV